MWGLCFCNHPLSLLHLSFTFYSSSPSPCCNMSHLCKVSYDPTFTSHCPSSYFSALLYNSSLVRVVCSHSLASCYSRNTFQSGSCPLIPLKPILWLAKISFLPDSINNSWTSSQSSSKQYVTQMITPFPWYIFFCSCWAPEPHIFLFHLLLPFWFLHWIFLFSLKLKGWNVSEVGPRLSLLYFLSSLGDLIQSHGFK